jgi:hypothetical protein
MVIASSKLPVIIPAALNTEEKPPSKTKRRVDKKVESTAQPLVAPSEPTVSASMSKSSSKDGSEVAGGKKKPKKKKRSVLANQSNPHHVDNCGFTR